MRLSFFYYMAALVLLPFYSSCAVCKNKGSNQSDHSTISHGVQVDDSVRHLFGDSISRIIFESDSIRLLKLSVTEPEESDRKDASGTDGISPITFHGCYIKQDYGAIPPEDSHLLLFLMSDRSSYYHDNSRVKSPFLPDMGLTIHKADSRIDVVVSFTGGQLYFFTEKGDKKYFKYTYERLFILFFQRYMNDERLEKMIQFNLI